jgi:glutamine amidotransferase
MIAIIESGGANFASICAALSRIGAETLVTSNPEKIKSASHVILPGVGAARYAMQLLREQGLVNMITALKQPVLGICLGQQLLCEYSEEDDTQCLGIMPMRVEKLKQARIIPHMGWNNMDVKNNTGLLSGIRHQDDFYFVHSYAATVQSPYTLATCDYGQGFSAVIQKDNFYGIQCHPEKSGKVGMRLLENFVRLS